MCPMSIPRARQSEQETIIAWWVRQAAATPDNVAVVGASGSLTYSGLESRSNEVARRLLLLGVCPEVVVAVCMSRSPEAIVAALGVLKAGGAYLPLDPQWPVDRLAYILNDARPGVLVTNSCLTETLASESWRTIAFDTDLAFTDRILETPDVDLSPENLAYVIYTSGSTGRPKGVEIRHLSLGNLIRWHQSSFAVIAADRATHLASVGFDASVWEVWPYLTAGASVFVVSDEVRNRPGCLRDWLTAQEITVSFVPTPLCEELIQLQWPTKTSLRLLLTGADRLNHYPRANLPFQLVNNYGPTECTVVATSGPVMNDCRPDRVPAIGRPIHNTRVYVLNDNLEPVTAGEAGEIHIAGLSLARGYRNHPELTAEKFIPNPFSTEPGSRLYKTGDIGRFLPDGQLAFLGRKDEQVKIRGYRVEPAEIVSVLNQHPSVRTSLVVAREPSPGDRSLVAYIVLRTDTRPSAAELRKHFQSRLPEYMVPAFFVVMPELPLGTNGKIDRAALPDVSDADVLSDDGYAPPRTPVEQRIARIVALLLQIEQVGVNDNFFLLGGNSLLGTQLITRIAETFDINLTLRTVFDNPTVRELSTQVERLVREKVQSMDERELRSRLSEIEEGEGAPWQ
jgi:amino acid adenylation domain-containing protein